MVLLRLRQNVTLATKGVVVDAATMQFLKQRKEFLLQIVHELTFHDILPTLCN
jgi:isocitrate/isopropylmalate dehydrogenase